VGAEEALAGDGRGLGAVVHTEFAVQAAELGLDRVLTDVEMLGELGVGHARGEQRQELTFSFGEAVVSARPAQRVIDSGPLGPSLEDDALTPCCGADAFNDLGSAHCFGDEAGCASLEDAPYESLMVGKTEDDYGARRGISDKITYALFCPFSFAVGVKQRDVDATARCAANVDLDDAEVGRHTEKRSQTFKDDLVVVLECDARRPGHRVMLQAPTT
jgi:hypothetical protein